MEALGNVIIEYQKDKPFTSFEFCFQPHLSAIALDSRFDNIVSFTNIGPFIGQPVKTYSSGMMVRLVFAVWISVIYRYDIAAEESTKSGLIFIG